jgi:transcriptional regulator with XRE-family HTH domain
MDLESTLDEVACALANVPPIWREATAGAQLAAVRRHLRVSGRHLADVSGVNQSNISRMERGAADARLETWKKLFSALGCEVILLPLSQCEDTEDLLQSQTLERQERIAAGWGRGHGRRW